MSDEQLQDNQGEVVESVTETVTQEPVEVIEKTEPDAVAQTETVEKTATSETIVVATEFAHPPVSEDTPIEVVNTPQGQLTLSQKASLWLKNGTTFSDTTIDQLKAYVITRTRVQMGDAIRDWSDADIIEYATTGTPAKKSTGGFVIDSVLRPLKSANEWSRGELEDFLRGELKATQKATPTQLFDAILTKWEIPSAWSEKQIRRYVLKKIVPEKTATGVWITDQVRELKPADHWNRNELKAWARGQIKPSQKAPENALVESARKHYQLSESMSAKLLKELLTNMKEEPATMSEIVIQHNLETYAREMKPGKILTEEKAASYQQLLYTTLNRVLKMDGTEFSDNWTMILDFVYSHRTTLFDETRAFRGVAALAMSNRDCRNFEQMMNLLLKTADPATRYSVVKDMNFDVVLRDVVSEQLRQKLLAFYRVGQ